MGARAVARTLLVHWAVMTRSAMPSNSVQVRTPSHAYEIRIEPGALKNPASWQGLPDATQAVIVTNTCVSPIYGQALKASLSTRYARVSMLELPDGESFKTWATLQTIFDHLLGGACDRKTVLFALGGGVVGDMAGFAASCYMRGVPYVQVPTTLLAQVDSSVGGKSAINHPLGKNMIGAFYQPERVICDLDTLNTLPRRELAAGLAETIKYGPIADADFLQWIEDHLDGLLGRDPEVLSYAVRRACEIKAWVVEQDEREGGLRAILNFGHTFGHAIEAGLGYGQWLHGEAVACGMMMASALSERLGLMPRSFVDRMERLLKQAALPVRAPAIGIDRFVELMQVDKKAEAGQVRFVVIESLGRAALRTAPDDMVRDVIWHYSEAH
jgi:3-dehydroquinate synthase